MPQSKYKINNLDRMENSSHRIVLVRHGESTWNSENKFTGWTDVALTEKGKKEAQMAGQMLKEKGFDFDLCFTSMLQRAICTFNNIAEEMNVHHIPVIKDWRLNEKSYGALQGLNKKQTAEKYGDEQVKLWRRSFNEQPPKLECSDERHPCNDKRYSQIEASKLPATECLKDTVDRVIPYWTEDILPQVLKGKNVIVAAHGNSLRALVKYLDGMTDEQILEVNIPTAIPLVYELDIKGEKIKSYYLLDEEELKAKMEAVANQGKA